jgi:hypothetical protein
MMVGSKSTKAGLGGVDDNETKRYDGLLSQRQVKGKRNSSAKSNANGGFKLEKKGAQQV